MNIKKQEEEDIAKWGMTSNVAFIHPRSMDVVNPST